MSDRLKWLGLNWQINPCTGWGILGLNLALQAERSGRMGVVPLVPTSGAESFSPVQREGMERVLNRERVACRLFAQNNEKSCRCEFPVVQGFGNRFKCVTLDGFERVKGTANLGIIFFEDTQLGDQARARSQQLDLVLAGSNWNKRVLESHGISHVATFLQGVDLSLFRPLRDRRSSQDKFFIFSGGKLEFRKGQDIAVAAFRKFHRRHADAVLVTAWHNPLPITMTTIHRGGYVTGCPEFSAQVQIDFEGWLESNGVPRSACRNVGVVPNHLLPEVYQQIDAAVLPNRCEGGTNLVAMECLACGVPTILSANTGHLDLLDEAHCYPLLRQGPVGPVPPFLGTEGWGESDVDEIVEALERVYVDRATAARRGAAAERFMQDWSWEKRFEEFVRQLKSVHVLGGG